MRARAQARAHDSIHLIRFDGSDSQPSTCRRLPGCTRERDQPTARSATRGPAPSRAGPCSAEADTRAHAAAHARGPAPSAREPPPAAGRVGADGLCPRRACAAQHSRQLRGHLWKRPRCYSVGACCTTPRLAAGVSLRGLWGGCFVLYSAGAPTALCALASARDPHRRRLHCSELGNLSVSEESPGMRVHGMRPWKFHTCCVSSCAEWRPSLGQRGQGWC